MAPALGIMNAAHRTGKSMGERPHRIVQPKLRDEPLNDRLFDTVLGASKNEGSPENQGPDRTGMSGFDDFLGRFFLTLFSYLATFPA